MNDKDLAIEKIHEGKELDFDDIKEAHAMNTSKQGDDIMNDLLERIEEVKRDAAPNFLNDTQDNVNPFDLPTPVKGQKDDSDDEDRSTQQKKNENMVISI